MQPFSLLIKPTGPDCNIACRYCFYCRKKELFGNEKHRMSEKVMLKLVRSYLAVDMPVHSFAWQGGEPTLMGLDFYQSLVDAQMNIGKGQTVSNALQTNGILLDDKWADFLARYKWLVGISLDGPKKYHDHYRKDLGGNGTYDRVMAGIEACKRHNVEYNILVLLNDLNSKHPDELFDFFTTETDVDFLQFVPCIETNPDGSLTDFSVTVEEYGEFMCRIFDRWLEYGPRKLSIRLFDSILSYIITGRHTNCTFARKCSDYMVIEHDGSAYCCDFFVEPQWKLGNIMDTPMPELINSKPKRDFARSKNKLDTRCLICRYSQMCRGGCLKDRLAVDGTFTKPSYLCSAYKRIFDYTLPKFNEIAAEIQKQNEQGR
jgi:uncharacterized protein